MKKHTKSTKKSDDVMSPHAMQATEQDLKNAVLIVSLTINVFVLSLWVALNVTSYYDVALTNFFFGR